MKSILLLLVLSSFTIPSAEAVKLERYTRPLPESFTAAQRSAAQAIADFTGDRADNFDKENMINAIGRQPNLNQETANEIIRLMQDPRYNQNGFDDEPVMHMLLRANLSGARLQNVSSLLRARANNAQAYGRIAQEYAAQVKDQETPEEVSGAARANRNALIDIITGRIASGSGTNQNNDENNNRGAFQLIQSLAGIQGLSSSHLRLFSEMIGSNANLGSDSQFIPGALRDLARIPNLTNEQVAKLTEIATSMEPQRRYRLWRNAGALLRAPAFVNIPTDLVRIAIDDGYSYGENNLGRLLRAYNQGGGVSPNQQRVIQAILANRETLGNYRTARTVGSILSDSGNLGETETRALVALAGSSSANEFFSSGGYREGIADRILYQSRGGQALSSDSADFLERISAIHNLNAYRLSPSISQILRLGIGNAALGDSIAAQVAAIRARQGLDDAQKNQLIAFIFDAAVERKAVPSQDYINLAVRAVLDTKLNEEQKITFLRRLTTNSSPAFLAYMAKVLDRIATDASAFERLVPYYYRTAPNLTDRDFNLALLADDAARRTQNQRPELNYNALISSLLGNRAPITEPQERVLRSLISINPANSRSNGLDENQAVAAVLRLPAMTESQAQVALDLLANIELFGRPNFRNTEALASLLERSATLSDQQKAALRAILNRQNAQCMLRFNTNKEELFTSVIAGNSFAAANEALLSSANSRQECRALVQALRQLPGAAVAVQTQPARQYEPQMEHGGSVVPVANGG